MIGRLIRWLVLCLLVLLVLLTGAMVWAYHHFDEHKEAYLKDFLAEKGLRTELANLTLEAWDDFPLVHFGMDSLSVTDTTVATPYPTVVSAASLQIDLSLAALLRDTVLLQQLTLTDATIFLKRDSSGNFRPGQPSTPSAAPAFSAPKIAWNGLQLKLDNVAATYLHPAKRKDIRLHIRRLTGSGSQLENGHLYLDGELDCRVGGMALNTEKGTYLRDATLRGPLALTFSPDSLVLAPTQLRIGEQDFAAEARISRAEGGFLDLWLSNPKTDFAATVALLNEPLQEKIAPFYVSGEVPVSARISTPLTRGANPLIDLDFVLSGQDAKLKEWQFTDVHLKGSFQNRLTRAEGGLEDPRRNLRFLLEDMDGYYGSIRARGKRAKVAVAGADPILRSDLHFSGPARAVSDWLENDNFFFRGGNFELDAAVDASLLSFEELTRTTDGELRFRDTRVVYKPADVRFPFRGIQVAKNGMDVKFDIRSEIPATGADFRLLGKLDNLTPLLTGDGGGELNTEVTLRSPHVTWTGFLSLFDTEGEFAPAETSAENSFQTQSMKQSLLGLQQTFHPSIDLAFDTVVYYDVFDLTDFRTGLRFDGDTLVLERTTFDWSGSNMAFGAKMDVGRPLETPFSIRVNADHIDLNRLRKPLDHFGLELPREIDSLPGDLSIDLVHSGRLSDTLGLMGGFNRGSFVFNDGRDHLFDGRMEYRPGPKGLMTDVNLSGDPQVVNFLFGSSRFFFGSGAFSLDLSVEQTPADLSELIRDGRMKLRVDSSRLSYRPADIFVPIRSFTVDLAKETADYTLHLKTDESNRSVHVDGTFEEIATFLLPTEESPAFRIRTDVRAQTLAWSDLAEFIQSESRDTTSFNNQSILSATGGIFNSFRPDLSLSVDTFMVSEFPSITDIFFGLSMEDSTTLKLEKSGFSVGSGQVQFDALYPLDNRVKSPFSAHFVIDSLDLRQLFTELNDRAVLPLDTTGDLSGQLSLRGDIRGVLDESKQQLIGDSTELSINYSFDELVLSRWPQLMAAGRKALMEERMQDLKFAPLSGKLTMKRGFLPIPQTEIQSTGFQLFVEGSYDMDEGPDLLITLPLSNLFRGDLEEVPAKTGYEGAGWRVFVSQRAGPGGKSRTKFRLGRSKWDAN